MRNIGGRPWNVARQVLVGVVWSAVAGVLDGLLWTVVGLLSESLLFLHEALRREMERSVLGAIPSKRQWDIIKKEEQTRFLEYYFTSTLGDENNGNPPHEPPLPMAPHIITVLRITDSLLGYRAFRSMGDAKLLPRLRMRIAAAASDDSMATWADIAAHMIERGTEHPRLNPEDRHRGQVSIDALRVASYQKFPNDSLPEECVKLKAMMADDALRFLDLLEATQKWNSSVYEKESKMIVEAAWKQFKRVRRPFKRIDPLDAYIAMHSSGFNIVSQPEEGSLGNQHEESDIVSIVGGSHSATVDPSHDRVNPSHVWVTTTNRKGKRMLGA
ncbi:unnamed protein product [Calypogeia fissa]